MTSPEQREQWVRERQDGEYEPPILAEPVGGPIPAWQQEDEDGGPERGDATAR